MCTRFYIDNTFQLENYRKVAEKSSLGRQMAFRMPLMLPEDAVEDWINPKNSNPAKLLPLALTEMDYTVAEVP